MKSDNWLTYCCSFVDRDMFMRYRGGGVGHRVTREAMRCLLNDRDVLDKQPFTFEHDHQPFEEGIDDDVPMDDSSSGKESEDDGSEMEDVDGGDGTQLIDNKLGDEMEEYGYSGLDQVLDDDEGDDKVSGNEDALGPEDGEDPDDEVGHAEL